MLKSKSVKIVNVLFTTARSGGRLDEPYTLPCVQYTPLGKTLAGHGYGVSTRRSLMLKSSNKDIFLQSQLKVHDFFQVKLHINTVGVKEVNFFLHNENQFWAPNSKNIWGSKHDVVILKKCDPTIGCHRLYELSRIHWKAMDYEKQRCDETGLNSNTTKCIHNLVRDRMGCYIPIDNMEPNGKPLCHTGQQFETAWTLLEQCMTDDESDVYKVTGCLSACEKVRNSYRKFNIVQEYPIILGRVAN